jgi:opacity protein-like surface antigen
MSVAKFVQRCTAALGIVAVSNPAQAADIYGSYAGYKDQPCCAQPLLWQGFYAGFYAGGAWSTVEPANNVVILGGSGTIPISSLNSSGFLGGAQFGYNIQIGNFVYGIETDFGGIDTGVTGSFADPSTAGRVLVVKSSGGFYGDITGRGGYAVGNALIYAKGGFAFFTGDIQVRDTFDRIAQDSGTFTGWTIGGGVEYLISPNLTIKAEFQHFGFDNNNFSCCTGVGGRIENALTSNTVKIGANFLIHGLRSPLY